jgi:integrase
MSVRQRIRRTRSGAVQKTWIVDVDFELSDASRAPRIRKVSPVQTKRGAEQYERQLRESLLSGTYGKEDEKLAPSVKVFAQEFLVTYAETNNKPSEVETKRMILDRHIIPAMGNLRLDEVGPAQIEKYKSQKLKDRLSPKTVNNHLIVLRRMLAVASEWGSLVNVPRFKWLKVERPSFDFLDFDESERLVAAADGDWQGMIALAISTGLRIGELLALRWEDLDLSRRMMMVRRNVARGIIGTPKSGKPRPVDLGRDIVVRLNEHRHLRGELVFCGDDGRMLSKAECKRPLWRACKRAGLRRIGWHVLRHTFASHLVMRGAPLRAIQELLGHASIEMTMRYAHLSADAKRMAVELLDRRHPDGTKASNAA